MKPASQGCPECKGKGVVRSRSRPSGEDACPICAERAELKWLEQRRRLRADTPEQPSQLHHPRPGNDQGASQRGRHADP